MRGFLEDPKPKSCQGLPEQKFERPEFLAGAITSSMRGTLRSHNHDLVYWGLENQMDKKWSMNCILQGVKGM